MSGEGPLVVKVDVEYCGAWGYGSRYEELRHEILSAYPSATVSGKVIWEICDACVCLRVAQLSKLVVKNDGNLLLLRVCHRYK